MRKCLIISSLLIGGLWSPDNYLSAQKQNDEYVQPAPRFEDYTYADYIRSVRFFPSDSETDYPVLGLGSPLQLVLQFDDLEAYTKNYFYKIIHCDSDWKPSTEISPIDYIEGFQENRIYDGRNASAPHAYNYVHYELRFPNEDVQIKKSGNYLLKVYTNNDEKELVISRRFMVVDTKVKVFPEMRRSATPPYAATHQEFRFSVQWGAGIQVVNAYEDIKVVVIQNGRWDTRISGLSPTFIKRDELVYDLQGKLMFPAMREFRPLDLRTYRTRATQVRNLEMTKNRFKIDLFDVFPRPESPYIFISDLNGKYILQSFDFSNDPHLRGEYGDVKFSLSMEELKDVDVYLFGGFTDWQLYEQNKMLYNKDIDAYENTQKLKNGYYDYSYVTAPKGSLPNNPKPDVSKIEGSSYETENDYLFLVYYRPYGGRYEQLVAVQKANSRPK